MSEAKRQEQQQLLLLTSRLQESVKSGKQQEREDSEKRREGVGQRRSHWWEEGKEMLVSRVFPFCLNPSHTPVAFMPATPAHPLLLRLSLAVLDDD